MRMWKKISNSRQHVSVSKCLYTTTLKGMTGSQVLPTITGDWQIKGRLSQLNSIGNINTTSDEVISDTLYQNGDYFLAMFQRKKKRTQSSFESQSNHILEKHNCYLNLLKRALCSNMTSVKSESQIVTAKLTLHERPDATFKSCAWYMTTLWSNGLNYA